MNVPSELFAGDSATWNDDPTKDRLGGVIDSTWTLKYVFSFATAITVTADARGSGWTASLDDQNTAGVAAGEYYWQAYAELGEDIDAVTAVQTVTMQTSDGLAAVPTAGKFKLKYGTSSTAFINWDDNEAAVQTAIQAIPALAAATVDGDPSTGFAVTFVGVTGPATLLVATTDTLTDTNGEDVVPEIVTTIAGVAASVNTLRRETIGTGRIKIRAAAGNAVSGKSQTQQDLEAVQLAMRNMIAGGAVQEYTIGGRSMRKMTMADLIMWEGKLKARLANEKAAEDSANGLGNPRNTYVRFVK